MADQSTRSTPTRRDAVALMGAAGFAAFAPPFMASAQAATPETAIRTATGTARGTVFEDLSGSGRREAGDPGIPGVLVSNGRDVVRTDAQGRYALPVEEGGGIFVIKPAGYAVPLDGNNLPRFTYLHQPAGTPPELGLRFPGIAPTGPLPDAINFALTRSEEPSAFDVILFTDPQPESATELSFVRDTAIAGVLGTRAAFGMTLGDIMFDDLSLLPRYNRLIGQVGVPWWHIGGNHDLNFEAPDARLSRETFKRTYGAPYYAFHHGQALFLMLDNVHYLGAKPGEQGGQYEGRFSEAQLAFVENVLRETPRDTLVVASMHIPLYSAAGDGKPSRGTANAEALIALFEGRTVLSLAGHTHTTEHHYLGAGGALHHHVLTAVSGSWWSGPFDRAGIACADSCDGTPNGYHVLSIDGAAYTTRFVPASGAAKAMRISLENRFHNRRREAARETTVQELLGSPLSADALTATDLVVNVFDGGPRTQVSCRVGRGRSFALRRVYRPDPFVEQVFSRNAATKKSWVEAIPSTHVWTGRLPADLSAGTHRTEVTVTDEYGREVVETLMVEVLSGSAEKLASRS